MAGIAAPNLPTFCLDVAKTRPSEVTGASWSDGMNRVGSNAPGIGVNTGEYDPKASDWARVADTAAHESAHLGGDLTGDIGGGIDVPMNSAEDPDFNNTLAFVQTAGVIAPDAVLDVTTGAVNRTGLTVPSGSWAWGVIPVA
jgi:hypothetical protein